MRITLTGTGDAFGAGGRLNTCFHVASASGTFLIDCGATALVSLRRLALDVNEIDAIFISHLHGDHFGGLPGFLLDTKYVSRRTRPLLIAGPPGLRERLPQAMEALYTRSSTTPWTFDLAIVELPPEQETVVAGVTVTPREVVHYSGAPSLALRLAVDGRILCYSGDTEWTDNLLAAARGADLFICECYMFERNVSGHLSYAAIMENYDRLEVGRLVLTHMGHDMLAHLDEVDRTRAMPAEDGLVLEL